jgi:magnesium chelatase subunit I
LNQLKKIQGLFEHLEALGVRSKDDAAIQSSAAEFILEGLWAHKRVNRSEERGFFAETRRTPEPREPREPSGRMPRRQFN